MQRKEELGSHEKQHNKPWMEPHRHPQLADQFRIDQTEGEIFDLDYEDYH